MRKLLIITLLCVVVVLAGATYYTFSLMFESQYDIKRGSFSYYVFIPQFIKDFPIISPASEPRYYSIPIDVHPGSNGIKYTTELNFDEACALLSEELNQRGIKIQKQQIYNGEYTHLNREVSTTLIVNELDNGHTEIKAFEEFW